MTAQSSAHFRGRLLFQMTHGETNGYLTNKRRITKMKTYFQLDEVLSVNMCRANEA